jgi:hypothetical protein
MNEEFSMEPDQIRARLREAVRMASPALLGGLALVATRVVQSSEQVRVGDAVGRLAHALAACGLITAGRFLFRLPTELDSADPSMPLREVAWGAVSRTLDRVHLRFTIEVYSWFLERGVTPAQLDQTLQGVIAGARDELASLVVRSQ